MPTDPSGNVVPFRKFKTPNPGENLTCECGSQWWAVAGVVIDRESHSVTGYAHPVKCAECGNPSPDIEAEVEALRD